MANIKTKGTALITGGAMRVGKQLALALASDGYNIALHYNSSKKQAEKTADEIRKLGVKCDIFSCNLNDSQRVDELINEVKNIFPDLNILVNNASIFEKCNFLDSNADIFDRHMNINFKAPFILSQDFAKSCKKGVIINMLDTYITSNNSEYCAYLLSKKSLYELTKMTAKTLAPDIRVNGICIGSLLTSKHWNDEDIKNHVSKLPLKCKPEIDDITATLLYLVESSYLTGQCIFVDSGQNIAI